MRYFSKLWPFFLLLSWHTGFAMPMLNMVKLQLQDEAWVSSDSARVVIALDASLNEASLAKLHAELLANLKAIAPAAEWHIIEFNRSKDQSNLERVQVLAEVRLPSGELASLNKRVAQASKPGSAYRIASIEFNPSLADIEQTRQALRTKIYTRVKAELSHLAQVFPQESYSLHEIIFQENYARPASVGKALMLAMDNAVANQLQVNNKLQLSANISLASKVKSSRQGVDE